MAELAQITRLAQPRVSTHLARLRKEGFVVDRREGVSVYYRINRNPEHSELSGIWKMLRDRLEDPLIRADAENLPEVLSQRATGRNWPDAVAGDMERHYSPGRTWESTARALVHLIRPGRVLDIASGDGIMGELLHEQAETVACVDASPRVVKAGKRRVEKLENVQFQQCDMHALPFADGGFDTVLMLHALTYSREPERAINEAARVLSKDGRLLGATLEEHAHAGQVAAFGHVNNGFRAETLRTLCEEAGLAVDFCAVTSIERKKPNFKIITLMARKP